MEKIILAFENEANALRLKEILESNAVAECTLCRTADQVRRAVQTLGISVVVCGYKLADSSCENLYADLPPTCFMMMVAVQSRLEMCGSDEIFKLPAPVRKEALISSVRMLLQMCGSFVRVSRQPQRSQAEAALVAQAKALLMDRHGMTEAQAHRFLQKRSMDSGRRLADMARLVLEEEYN